jgi:uncharacterized phage infection (PIP) family protein YhgE
MAGTTIHSLAYIVTANTEQFEKGMMATRQELRASKKIMEESVPEIVKYQKAMQNLDSMLAKGLIDKRAHTDTVAKLKTDYGQMSNSAKLLAEGSDKFGRVIRGWGSAAVGVFTVSKAINAIKHEFDNIDATLKEAEKLGIAIDDLMRLRQVADMAGDASAESVDAAISKLNRNLKQLREGAESATEMFAQIGLTADDLQNMDLGDAFLKVADGIAMIEGADKQLAITQEILGKGAGDLANMMKLGADEIERMGAGVPAVNAIDAEKVAKAKDAMEKIDRNLTSIAQTIAIALAPALEEIGRTIDWYFVGPEAQAPRARNKAPTAGPQNALGSEWLMREFQASPTLVDDQELAHLIEMGTRADPNFSMTAASASSPRFDQLSSNMHTLSQRYTAGRVGMTEYETETRQLFHQMFLELMRMRQAQEQANEQTASEEAKVE